MSKNPLRWAEETRTFFNEVQVEFKKVTWPSQKETVAGAIGVVVLILIVGLSLALVDLVLAEGMLLLWP